MHRLTVPEHVMERLHQANEDFHQARLRLDAATDVAPRQRAEIATALRTAEANLEEVTKEIDALLKPKTPKAD